MTAWRIIFVVGIVVGGLVLIIGTYADLLWLRFVGLAIQGLGVAVSAAVWWPNRNEGQGQARHD